MRVEAKMFIVIAIFFVPVGLLYGFWSGWTEMVGPFGLFLRVPAEQIVQGVPAGPVFGEQVRLDQPVEAVPGLPEWHAGEARGGGGVNVRPGVQAQQTEGAGRVWRQVLVGVGERGPQATVGIASVQHVQSRLFVAQLAGEIRQRQVR